MQHRAGLYPCNDKYRTPMALVAAQLLPAEPVLHSVLLSATLEAEKMFSGTGRIPLPDIGRIRRLPADKL